MKTIITSLLLFTSLSAFSQLEFIQEAFASGHESGSAEYTFTVTNTGSEDAVFWWELEIDREVPFDWEFIVCDQLACYDTNYTSIVCEEFRENILGPGESVTYYKVTALFNDVPGEHTVVFRMIEDCSTGNGTVVGEVFITFSTSPTNVLDNSSPRRDVILHPNPVYDNLFLSNDKDVSNVAVCSTLGQTMYMQRYETGNSIDVSEINSGIYIARMLDDKNNVVAVRKFYKN